MKQSKSNGFGVTSMVTALVGLFIFDILLGTTLGIIAIVFGAIGLSKKQKYSIVGLTIGIINCVIGLLTLIGLT